jgi:hypothetical protein
MWRRLRTNDTTVYIRCRTRERFVELRMQSDCIVVHGDVKRLARFRITSGISQLVDGSVSVGFDAFLALLFPAASRLESVFPVSCNSLVKRFRAAREFVYAT